MFGHARDTNIAQLKGLTGQQDLALLVAGLLERSGTLQSYTSLGELNAVQGQSLAGRPLMSLQELAAFLRKPVIWSCKHPTVVLAQSSAAPLLCRTDIT